MSPWWLRPTAEGTNEENREPNRQESRPEPPAETPSPETPSLGATPPEPAPLAEQPPISQGTEPAPEPSWRREPDRSVEELKASREREDREDETRAETAEPAFEASIADALDEGPAELQAGELEAQEEGPEEEGKAETRKKRPRRSRRGRKNGRSATASPETAEDEEDDEDREEPAHEVPAPPPLPSPRRQPAHMAVAPAPSPAPRPVRAPEPAWVPAPTTDFERLAREIIISVPERQRGTDERKIAMFCDLENIALGVRDSEIGKFDINLILERLLEKGKIIVKKAYADWERYSDYKRPFHEAAIELIDIPQKFYSGKNSADIKMVVDAMDLSYSKEHLDTFVILSGDSDFSPLVSKLKENNKYVIGVGVKNSSSNLLIDNCDEFLYYEDVWRDNQKGPKLDGLNKKTAEVFSLMIESIQALLRENKDVLWGSMIKQTMQRKKPSFNEGYYGYTTFSELLEDAERKNILKLKKDQRSGTYIVIGFASRTEPVPAARR